MARFKLFVPLLLVFAVGVFFYSTMGRISEGDYNPQALPSALLNKPIPHFSLPSLADDERLLAPKDMLGEIALINVWATWCPSCHIEHPYLNYLAKKMDVVIYGINYKDDAKKAVRWLKNKGDPYRFNVFDEQGRLGLDLGVTGAPETYVIDHRGFIRMRHQGPVSGVIWSQKIAPLIERLQREKEEFEQG